MRKCDVVVFDDLININFSRQVYKIKQEQEIDASLIDPCSSRPGERQCMEEGKHRSVLLN